MSKAEEAAYKTYPYNGDYRGQGDSNSKFREAFIKGYLQAEEDNEPTLEDIEIIINAFLDLCIENKEQGKTKRYTDKEWCQEVLKRFKNLKK